MAKDYMHDIVPPTTRHTRHSHKQDEESTPIPIHATHEHEGAERSIRNISAPTRTRQRPSEEYAIPRAPKSRRTSSRFLIWAIAALCILTLGALLLVALRPTRVTVIPRTHALNFSAETFTAYPELNAGLETFTYGTETITIEDSDVVPSEGTVYAEDKASGNITVYNNYQTAPLTLVRNTRFETSSGLIFRAPADVVIPGKQGNTPGSVEITVVADQAGEEYNVAPGKFTVPGLSSTPAMFAQVYAESTGTFTGGFKGERPGVPTAALESAIQTVRMRLEDQARDAVAQIDPAVIALPELMEISFESLPNTSEAGDNVRIHQRANVTVPIFSPELFAYAVSSAAVDTDDATGITFVPSEDFSATAVGTSTILGTTPLSFALSGGATLVWQIDEATLQNALAGKDKSAFEAIVGGFSSVQEANARIQPFWRTTFPSDPADISIKVEDWEMAR